MFKCQWLTSSVRIRNVKTDGIPGGTKTREHSHIARQTHPPAIADDEPYRHLRSICLQEQQLSGNHLLQFADPSIKHYPSLVIDMPKADISTTLFQSLRFGWQDLDSRLFTPKTARSKSCAFVM